MQIPGLRSQIRSIPFLAGMGGIFLLQLSILLFTTPLYDIDTNSFVRGGLTWDVYHNPLENIFLAVASKISANATFIISLQLLFYSFAVTVFIHTLFTRTRWLVAASLVAALEPVSLFYHFHFLPESFYTSFLLLTAAFLIRWMNAPVPATSALAGFSLGMAFMAKLAAVIHLPLFALFLLNQKVSIRTRFLHLAWAVLPFAACYFFVGAGQHFINKGALYTVAGRVRWDFASSQYEPTQSASPEFSRYVDSFIVKEGKVIPHRELRRELSYLGYKKCVAEYESHSGNENAAIACCDSIFDVVGSDLIQKHFWKAELQFVKDNVYAVHHWNYLDYRHTPGLPWYHAESEWQYLDSLMEVNYGLNLKTSPERIPGIWQSLSFSNAWIPALWWMTWAFALYGGLRFLLGWWRTKVNLSTVISGVLALMVVIPWVFHLVYISYRPRFLAPYFVIIVLWAMHLLTLQMMKTKGNE